MTTWPNLTAWPAATFTSSILPGIGASTVVPPAAGAGAGAAGAVEKDRQTKAPADDVSAGAFLPDDGMPFKAAGQVLR